jgi:hypothetical protein
VPSSTSSSRAVPAGDWRATWVVAIVAAIAIVGFCEHLSRARGQRPNVADDPVSWALARRTVDDDANVVAFVGTSRMQLAYSARAFAEAAPRMRGVQLAIDGVPAIGVLADLAADPNFKGIAAVDLDEWDVAWGDLYAMAKPYIARAHALWRAPGALANRLLAGRAQEQLAVLAVGGRPIATALVHGRWPAPTWVVADRDRISHGDAELTTAAALRAKADKRLTNFDEPPPPPDVWLQRALAIDPLVAQIRAHGGDVVIVRLPVSGRLAAGFAEHYPRATYWDAFAAKSSAHVVHFRDVPAMRDLTCPDEMHLDERDQPQFTRALVDIVRAATLHEPRSWSM